jgi:hypothetical protein
MNRRVEECRTPKYERVDSSGELSNVNTPGACAASTGPGRSNYSLGTPQVFAGIAGMDERYS